MSNTFYSEWDSDGNEHRIQTYTSYNGMGSLFGTFVGGGLLLSPLPEPPPPPGATLYDPRYRDPPPTKFLADVQAGIVGFNPNNFILQAGDWAFWRGLNGNETLTITGNNLTFNNFIVGHDVNNVTLTFTMRHLNGGSNTGLFLLGSGNDWIDTAGFHGSINAGAGNDTYNGGAYDDVFIGGDGNDLAYGGIGADLMDGDAGSDTLYGGAGSDVLDGGLGDDQIFGGDGLNLMSDPGGNTYVTGGNGGNHVDTGWGADTIITGWGLDVIFAGEGSDRIEAGEGNNYVDAGGGNDTIYTGNGTDIIFAGGGDDVVYAGNGLNAISGGDGADLIYAGLDSANVDGGGGNDTIFTADQSDTVRGGEGADVIQAGHGTNYVEGGGGNDLIDVGNSNDTVLGGSGNDTINGYAGNDSLRGGDGSDTIYAAEGNDTLAGDGGDDILYGGTSYSHLDGGHGNDLLIGGDEGNSAFGGAGNDTLQGGAGNDVLDGGGNTDTLYGAAGDDAYYVDDAKDRTIEVAGSGLGGGNDTVYASVSYVLGDDVENLTLLRGFVPFPESLWDYNASDLNATGNSLNNVITGNNGDNVVDGGGGADTLIGGLGDDTYIVDSADDVVNENGFRANASPDIDTVHSKTATYTLTANVENLVLGAGAVSGNGNALGNTLWGNDGDNTLNGMDGDDFFFGGAGNDTIRGGNGYDTVVYDKDFSNYMLTGSAGSYVVTGPDGTDVLTGVEWITFNGFSPMNTRPAKISDGFALRELPFGVEFRLKQSDLLQGYADSDRNDALVARNLSFVNGTVSAQADGSFLVTVNDGYVGPITLTYEIADRFGGVISASLSGTSRTSAGDTEYVVLTESDVVSEAPGGGVDIVTSYLWRYRLPDNVENGVLGGTSYWLDANDSDNVLRGNRGENAIYAGSRGRDLIFGGDGDDLLEGGAYWVYLPGISDYNDRRPPSDGMDTIYGGLGDDLIYIGNLKDNVIYGGAGTDSVTLKSIAPPDQIQIVTDGAVTTLKQGSNTTTLYNVEYIHFEATSYYLGVWEYRYHTITLPFVGPPVGNPYRNTPEPPPNFHTVRGGPGLTVTQADLLDGFVNPNGVEMRVVMIRTYIGDVYYPDDNGNFLIPGYDFRSPPALGPSDLPLVLRYDILDELGGKTYVERTVIFDYRMGDDHWIADAGAFWKVTEIENGGNDTVSAAFDYTLGNHVENLILTGDAIRGTGNALRNHLTGNDKDNILNGEAGIDTMVGGLGDDTYVVNHARETVIENASEGHDAVISYTASYRLTENVEALTLGGRSVSGFGNNLDNMMIGNAQNNTLVGEGGNDTINGRGGADRMSGDLGDDVYFVDHVQDNIVETEDGGRDRVISTIDWRLGDNIDNLDLRGNAVNGLGNALDNSITGNSLDNVLAGFDGNDTLNGRQGADTMDGGAGNDRFFVDHLDDVVLEGNAGGIDLVISSVDFTLGDFVENLVLTGGAQGGAGNSRDNTVTGNSLDNVLAGFDGNDTLNGRQGADTMDGGAGNDRFFVDHLDDIVLEGDAGGIDQVLASVDFTLGDFVENLVLRGGAQSGTGNALNNSISGNAQDNILSGMGGADRLSGGEGADTLSGGLGKDSLIGGAGADHFVFDQLDTSPNADRIFDFVSGTDRLVLDRDAFAGLSGLDLGALNVDAFVEGSAALTADHRLIYASASGALSYDADGVGGQDGVLLAQFGAGTALQGSDIWLI